MHLYAAEGHLPLLRQLGGLGAAVGQPVCWEALDSQVSEHNCVVAALPLLTVPVCWCAAVQGRSAEDWARGAGRVAAADWLRQDGGQSSDGD